MGRWDGKKEQRNIDNGEPAEPQDPERLAKKKELCVGFRKKVDPREQNELSSNVPSESIMLALVDHCAKDMYWGLNWNEPKMVDMVCDSLAPKIKTERMDLYAASQRLKDDAIADNDIEKDRKSCARCNPPRTEALKIMNTLSKEKNLVDEIKQSLAAIKAMTYSACDDKIPNTDMSKVDVKNHAFRNTQTWSCGKPSLPPQSVWAEPCKDKNDGDSCTAACKPSYTVESGNGVTTCGKVQGDGLDGVDVTMEWSASSLKCRACHVCDDQEEVQTRACAHATTTACACKPGFYGEASAHEKEGSCKKCAAGTYSPRSGMSACSDCPDGKFAAGEGKTVCTSCSSCSGGKTVDESCSAEADTKCHCAVGYAGSDECSLCKNGKYSDETGLTIAKLVRRAMEDLKR